MKIIFTSYRDSMLIGGLKLSIERHVPKLCSYPVVPYLALPQPRNISAENIARIHEAILDNNWGLIQNLIRDASALGIEQIVLCCWCTEEQLSYGKACVAPVIGKYIENNFDDFKVDIEYRDGRG